MTLEQTKTRYTVQGIDEAQLDGQEEAFQRCMALFESLEKTKTINRKHGSYGLKHIVENPTGRFGIPTDSSKYTGYVYEGTLVLAALANGFTCRYDGLSSMKCHVNFSERSLKQWAVVDQYG